MFSIFTRGRSATSTDSVRRSSVPVLPSPSSSSSSSANARVLLVTKEGYLEKEGEHWRTWKKRWFRLHGTVLSYFTDKDSTTAKGVIPLTGITLVESGSTLKYPHMFQIKSAPPNDRVYSIIAESDEDKADWIRCIRNNMAYEDSREQDRQEELESLREEVKLLKQQVEKVRAEREAELLDRKEDVHKEHQQKIQEEVNDDMSDSSQPNSLSSSSSSSLQASSLSTGTTHAPTSSELDLDTVTTTLSSSFRPSQANALRWDEDDSHQAIGGSTQDTSTLIFELKRKNRRLQEDLSKIIEENEQWKSICKTLQEEKKTEEQQKKALQDEVKALHTQQSETVTAMQQELDKLKAQLASAHTNNTASMQSNSTADSTSTATSTLTATAISTATATATTSLPTSSSTPSTSSSSLDSTPSLPSSTTTSPDKAKSSQPSLPSRRELTQEEQEREQESLFILREENNMLKDMIRNLQSHATSSPSPSPSHSHSASAANPPTTSGECPLAACVSARAQLGKLKLEKKVLRQEVLRLRGNNANSNGNNEQENSSNGAAEN